MKNLIAANDNSSVKSKPKVKRALFYTLFIAFPIIHYLVFYVYINLNSFLMAFRTYSLDPLKGMTFKFAGWQNFSDAWQLLVKSGDRIWTSVLFLAVSIFFSTPLALLFSYYIYKKRFASGVFRVMLFLPQILSGVILGLLFRYMCNQVAGWFAEKWFHTPAKDLLTSPSSQVWMVIFFNVLMSFGVNVLTYSGTMSGINQSLIESAELDGCNPLQEFRYIVLPMIWPTVTTLMVVGFSRIFTEQWQVLTLLSMYPGKADNMGYYLYVEAMNGDFVATQTTMAYGTLSALGLILTAIILPLTMVLRWALDKYGPKAE